MEEAHWTGHLEATDVMTLLVSGNDLYVGGNFTNVDDNGAVLIAADYIAR